MKAALLFLGLAACDPVWGAKLSLRDPASRPIDDATLAVACNDSTPYWSKSIKTKRDGSGFVGSIGGTFPVGCDVFIAKPGYQTRRIAYRELCPNGPEKCDRVFEFDLVLEPD
jgi:hypothetical protein